MTRVLHKEMFDQNKIKDRSKKLEKVSPIIGQNRNGEMVIKSKDLY